MGRMTPLEGVAVALLLTIGCEGAPRQNVETRTILADPYIAKGEAANIEDFPHQISIEFEKWHRCGGAIVSEDYVVTAAHCIDPPESGPTSAMRVRAGSTTSTISSSSRPGGITLEIAETKTHSKFCMETIDYDIGVIKVSKKFVYSSRIQPISVPPAGEDFLDYSLTAIVSGWGDTRPNDPSNSDILLVVKMPPVTPTKCREIYDGAPLGLFTKNITTRMLCGAGTGKGGPCSGDSGGAIVHKGQLVGLVSWAVGCNDNEYPAVFTNVLNYEIRGFIKQNTGI